jgi:hypothetical protein
MDPVIVAKRLEAAADCLTGLSFDLADSSDLAGLRAALNRVRGSVQVTEARFVTRVAALADRVGPRILRTNRSGGAVVTR